jgi:RnfABCDGE-type electron transport complex G subunit
MKTAAKINSAALDEQHYALQQVFPAPLRIEQRSGAAPLPPLYWAGMAGPACVAYAFEVSARGYSSDIKLMVAIDTAGTILGIHVLSQAETPGRGTRISEIVSHQWIWDGFRARRQRQEPWFTKQFAGCTVTKRLGIDKSGEWHALDASQQQALRDSNNISAIAGATVSTAAVCRVLEKKVASYLELIRRNRGMHDR